MEAAGRGDKVLWRGSVIVHYMCDSGATFLCVYTIAVQQ
jgi:hypothetical protein